MRTEAVAAKVPLPPSPTDGVPSPASVTLPETTPRSSVLGAGVAGARGSLAGTDGAVVVVGGFAVGVATSTVPAGAAAIVAPRCDPLSAGALGTDSPLPAFDPCSPPATGCSPLVVPPSLPEHPVMNEAPRNMASTLHPE